MLFSNFATLLVFGIGVGTASAGVQRTNGLARQEAISGLAYTACQFAMSSNPDLSDNSNVAIGDFLDATASIFFNNFPPQDFELIEVFDFDTTHNDDGTNNITAAFAVEDAPEADLTSLLNTWVGLTVNGTEANWTFAAITCQAAVVTCNLAVSSNPVSNETIADIDLPSAESNSIANQFVDAPFLIGFNPIVPDPNLEGNYNITSFIGVGDVTDKELLSFVSSWEGTTLSGQEAQWSVEVADCAGA
ncbi:hypothetical protein D9757_005967 [Collybiopsis confluens]|uniref:Uncharacterized protein n=1 Tax=Collybiopsis confluens TaxID=2823264 RepID=A0A8H5MD87_9AGAR|nr:hypothetical protein D9757_005967 [Collybiopsis confluens]